MDNSTYDFTLVFEKLKESEGEHAIDAQIDIENFEEENESILQLMEIKSEIDDYEQETIFTTT